MRFTIEQLDENGAGVGDLLNADVTVLGEGYRVYVPTRFGVVTVDDEGLVVIYPRTPGDSWNLDAPDWLAGLTDRLRTVLRPEGEIGRPWGDGDRYRVTYRTEEGEERTVVVEVPRQDRDGSVAVEEFIVAGGDPSEMDIEQAEARAQRATEADVLRGERMEAERAAGRFPSLEDWIWEHHPTIAAEYGEELTAFEDEGEDEDWEPDGEAFRGGEAAAYQAEQQAAIQRDLKR